MDAVLYVHGKGGDAAESGHFRPLFPDCAVYGLDYRSDTPWETAAEFRKRFGELSAKHGPLLLIANSIGAYYSMNAGIGPMVRKAWFISPIVDMERLILDRMAESGIGEDELRERGRVPTGYGDDLSWDYLCYVRRHPIEWKVPTEILYGEYDILTSSGTMRAFAEKHGAGLTVMEKGEHWFHTEEQIRFLDDWILSAGGRQDGSGRTF